MESVQYPTHTLAPDTRQGQLNLVKPVTAECNYCPYCHGIHMKYADFVKCREDSQP